MARSRLLLVAVATLTALLGAGGASAPARSRPLIRPPASIAKAHKLLYCSDITYPPLEFYRGSKAVGADVDTAVARLMGVKAGFANTGFDGIIPALLSRKCD